jgi:hypothetical protein
LQFPSLKGGDFLAMEKPEFAYGLSSSSLLAIVPSTREGNLYVKELRRRMTQNEWSFRAVNLPS